MAADDVVWGACGLQSHLLCSHSERVMAKAGTTDAGLRSVPWWRWAFVGVVMFSLVITLATRTFHVAVPHSTTVQSNSPQAMRQHMDRDAVRWALPVPRSRRAGSHVLPPRGAGRPACSNFPGQRNLSTPTTSGLLIFFPPLSKASTATELQLSH